MRPLLFLLLPLLPGPALAQDEIAAHFDVRFGPLRVAEIMMSAVETDSAYSAAGRVTSAGLAGAFRTVRFDLAAEGRRRGDGFLPLAYREDVDTGRRTSIVDMVYPNGAPVVLRISPETESEPWDVDPAGQRGTTDPMSALYRLVRPRPYDALCDWELAVFDGRRRSSLALGPVETGQGRAWCYGEYRRVAGFAPEDMEERRSFPFFVEFVEGADGDWRLTRAETQTLYGRVRILSRD